MGEVSYEPLIRDMTWSYSRIKAYDDCPYRWFLKYIHLPKAHRKAMFFSDYGSFVHALLASYYAGEKTADQLPMDYQCGFLKEVRGTAPNRTVFQNYFTDGLRCVQTIRPPEFRVLSVENKIAFTVGSARFSGYIDLLAEDEGGELLVIDHKSRALKPRSTRKTPTKADLELDAYLRQLYLYSAWVSAHYGKFPKLLCFNCFRRGAFLTEPFSEAAYREALDWASGKIEAIAAETEFQPRMEYFKCRHLCEMQEHCEYYALSRR